MFYEPGKKHDLPYDAFRAIVAPRPIAWISTRDGEDRLNLAPYSFFTALSPDPMLVGFSSQGMKDTANNIKETGEFVVNLATRQLAEAVNLSSAAVAHEVDEFELVGLTPAPSNLVAPPRVAESPAALECKLSQLIPLQAADGTESGRYFVTGQVVGIHIDDRFLRDGLFDMVAAGTIARCGYRDYTEVTSVFEMTPPTVR